jgi:hypothetical protein
LASSVSFSVSYCMPLRLLFSLKYDLLERHWLCKTDMRSENWISIYYHTINKSLALLQSYKHEFYQLCDRNRYISKCRWIASTISASLTGFEWHVFKLQRILWNIAPIWHLLYLAQAEHMHE